MKQVGDGQPAATPDQIEETPEGLRISIPAPRRWFLILFLPVWLGFWAFAWIGVASEVARGPLSPFLVLWLAGWTIGGAAALQALLYSLAGREVIALTGSQLITRRALLGVGRSRAYTLTEVRELRVGPEPLSGWGHQLHWIGLGSGTIAFDYGARTYRFGSAIDEAEAKQVVARMKRRFPELARGRSS